MLKGKWSTLTISDEKLPHEKKARNHMARECVISESIVDALRKKKGGSSSSSVQKVLIQDPSGLCLL
jgi:hypothetical protein